MNLNVIKMVYKQRKVEEGRAEERVRRKSRKKRGRKNRERERERERVAMLWGGVPTLHCRSH